MQPTVFGYRWAMNNLMPSPFAAVPVPDDVVDLARVASDRRAVEKLSKRELVALILHYGKVYAERSQELELLERMVAQQSKGN